jgi:dihydroflavonol-4-reductase
MNSTTTKGTVLVTGGTGFLGAYVIRELLDKGYAVRAIRRGNTLPAFIPAHRLQQAQWIAGDVLDVSGLEEAMEGVDGVIHTAAMVSFSGRDRSELFRVNVEGSASMWKGRPTSSMRRSRKTSAALYTSVP